MSIKIGFFSDPHASPAAVAAALAVFRREGVSRIFCGGDIAGYGDQLAATVALIEAAACDGVLGNHDRDYLEQHRGEVPTIDRLLGRLPRHRALTLAGRRIYLVHAHPPDANRGGIKLRDKTGAIDAAAVSTWTDRLAGFGHDLLLVGHTHQVYATQLADTLLVNPGSCRYNHSCAVIALPSLAVTWFALQREPIAVVWNWGVNERRRR